MYYNYYFKNESPAIGARILDESKSPFPYDGLVKTITTTDEYGCPTGFKMIAGFESEGKRIEKEINVSSMTPMQVLDNIKIATAN